MKKDINGFTLVELSIVLVIVGLITSGIVGGQALIESASIKRVALQVEGYKTAIRTFETQFNFLPGDFPEAGKYWAAVGCVPDPNTPQYTCEGNGDGVISGQEGIRAWQHLALAEIIPGEYNGIEPLSSWRTADELYATHPSGPIDSVYNIALYPDYLTSKAGMVMIVAGVNQNLHLELEPSGQLFTAGQAQAIDKKFDDGIAGDGEVRGFRARVGDSFGPNCHDAGGDYELQITSPDCVLLFYIY